ncbi:MAG: hypothetical protein AMXMBFR57_23950 [Acidimicrobiia bacterium]
MADMSSDPGDALDALTPSQREWARHSERLWQRAYALASDAPAVDPGDVYHALRCLELPPEERLKRGLSRGRLRTHAR